MTAPTISELVDQVDALIHEMRVAAIIDGNVTRARSLLGALDDALTQLTDLLDTPPP